MTNSFAIQTSSLTRRFKQVTAVDALNLSIPAGELFGLVGPDGAGKTTLLRLLAGLLHISSGDGKVLGFDLQKQSEDLRWNIGYMAQNFSLYSDMSVEENLIFFADLFNVDQNDRKHRMQKLLTFAGLTDFRKRPAGKLSGGMQKKLALACTLIHQPQLLLLDEPTTGVDPISRREFWDILTELHLQGTTIVVSTPYMDEADRCSRVGLIYEGNMVRIDQPANIRSSLEGDMIEVIVSDWQQAKPHLENLDGVYAVETYGETLRLQVDDAQKRISQVRSALINAGLNIQLIRHAQVRMEDAFIAMIRELEK